MSIDIHVPTLGESVSDATIARWIKKAGDSVAADEPIVELETDKVTLEVPSPVAGKLGEIIAAEGETVEVGALLARVEEGAAGTKPAPKQEAPKSAPATAADEAPAPVAALASAPAN
jgi:2-oxoglutarate dehydrogenase E2 component (dihydrolipoamide succinyltransferase)